MQDITFADELISPPTVRDIGSPFNEEEDEEDVRAIPFIRFVPSEGKFELDQEAEEFLNGLADTKLGVVAVCGKYRTGKSYLLNKLFVETYFQSKKSAANKKSGFQVSPTINACTKGLWLWKKVITTENASGQMVKMIVIDTEGLGAFDEDENHDAKIFLLALLLSSLLIYNSVGTIDENALNSLSLVINLSKKIQLKAGQDQQEDVDQLAKMFPSFLWVLRDFALKLVDPEGNKLSPKQYLESALKEQKGCSESVESKNRLRRLLSHFFQERDCCTLVRPTEKEKDLQSLIKLQDNELRGEFIEQMSRLKQKVMGKAKVKTMNGHPLNGPMLIELANSYIIALNEGQVPIIENAWTNVCHFEQERAFKEAQQVYQREIQLRIKNVNLEVNIDIKNILKEIREDALQSLKKNFLGDIKALENYRSKLSNEIKIQSKKVTVEMVNKQEQNLSQSIEKLLNEELEARVRRGDTNLSDFESLFTFSDQLLQQILQANSGKEAFIESIYRKLLHQKLPRLLEQVHSSHCKMPHAHSIRTMEHQIKLATDETQRFKEDRLNIQRESFEKSCSIDRERQELLKNYKLLELKLADANSRLHDSEKQLKQFKQTVTTHNIQMQTESILQIDQQIQASLNPSVQAVYVSPEKLLKLPAVQNNNSASPSKKMTVCPPQFLEQNMKILQEILQTLNTNTANSISNLNSTSNEPGYLAEILQNNQVLSRAIDQSERRCTHLEKQLDKKLKYEYLIKNCQRLQCRQCNKLYTPQLFQQHYSLCKRESQYIPKSNSNFSRTSQFEESTRKQAGFQVKVLEINKTQQLLVDDNYRSPYFKEVDQEDEDFAYVSMNQQINSQTQVQFCVSNEGQISYIQRSLQQIMNVMTRIQKRINSPSEQGQIARWVMEIEKYEIEENYSKMAEVIETFFNQIHQKILANNLRLNKHVIIEDIEGLSAPQHLYVNEFVEFFQLSQTATDVEENEQRYVKPFQVESNDHYDFQHGAITTSHRGSNITYQPRYTQGGDDEVILHTPYDEDENMILIGGSSNAEPAYRRGSCSIVNQEESRSIGGSSAAVNAVQRRDYSHDKFVSPGAGGNTIHLEDTNLLDSQSLHHQVSFFSTDNDDVQLNQRAEDSLSSRGSSPASQGDFNLQPVVTIEKQQPFAPIDNTLFTKNLHLQPFSKTQKLNYLEQDAHSIHKKSFQSPLPSGCGKKMMPPQRPLHMIAAAAGLSVQQHQSYFNNITNKQFSQTFRENGIVEQRECQNRSQFKQKMMLQQDNGQNTNESLMNLYQEY